MKAMILETVGSALVLVTSEKPVLSKGQVLVKISHSGVNPLDLKIAEGKADHAQTSAGAIIGIDMSGTVVEIGEGVSTLAVGDEVFGMVGGIGGNQGTLAEYIAVDADHISMKPKNSSMKEAAAIPLVFITAWEGLVDRAKVSKGQKVLVHGGAGGVGQMAIQIAKAFGAEVYATGSGKDLTYLKSMGVVAIDYTTEKPEYYLQRLTNSEGFDIVFDTVGGATLDASFNSVKTYTGHVVSSRGWGTHSIAPLSFKGATYSGVFTLLPLLTGKGKAHHGEILNEAKKIMESGNLKPLLDESNFGLQQVNEAYERIQNRNSFGKVVINVIR